MNHRELSFIFRFHPQDCIFGFRISWARCLNLQLRKHYHYGFVLMVFIFDIGIAF